MADRGQAQPAASDEAGGATSEGCVFCRIVRGEAPAAIVFEDAISLAFLDHRPLVPGHCLLVPKAHHETLADLPAPLVGPLFANAQLLSRAVERGLEADGSFVAINNRVSQSVPHLHVHVVPRRKGDRLFASGYVWKRRPYEDQEDVQRTRAALRDAMGELQAGQTAS